MAPRYTTDGAARKFKVARCNTLEFRVKSFNDFDLWLWDELKRVGHSQPGWENASRLFMAS